MSRVGGQRPGAGGTKGDAAFQVLLGALISAGKAKTPVEARKLLDKVIAQLRQGGAKGADAEAVLKSFQKENGLPTTGKLDAKTLAALTQKGMLSAEGAPRPDGGKAGETKPGATKPGATKPGAGAPSAGKPGADKPTTGPSGKPTAPPPSGAPTSGRPVSSPAKPGAGAAAPGAPATTGKPPAADASKMERNPKKGAFTSFAGTRPDAPRAETQKAPVPGAVRPKNLEVREVTKRTRTAPDADTQAPQKLLENLSQRGLAQPGAPASAQTMREALRAFQMQNALPATGKMDDATKQQMVEQGVLTAEGKVPTAAPTADAGGALADAKDVVRDVVQDPAAAAQADHPVHVPEEGEAQVVYGLADVEAGYEDESGNAHSGDDDDDDAERGHTQLKDDDEADEEGYYRVPALAVQVRAALNAIVRDDDGSGAPTYAWDVTVYRPGVYGRRQKATPLWHVGISGCSPFDAVWAVAQGALEERIGEADPDVLAPTLYEFRLALQRARARADLARP